MLNFTHADFSRIKKITCHGPCVFENKSFIHHCYAFNLFLTFSLFAMEIRWCDRAHLFLWISNNAKKFCYSILEISKFPWICSLLRKINQILYLRTWNSTTNIAITPPHNLKVSWSQEGRGNCHPIPKLCIRSTLNIDLILWHTKLTVCAVKC